MKPDQKRRPMRTCISCRSVLPKRQLLRLVKDGPGGVLPDATGKMPGRGAYLCTNPDCWENALHSGLLATALRLKQGEVDQSQVLRDIKASILN